MAKYWAYVNDAVAGPFSVEQLVRVRGFSRQTQVCVDEGGKPGEWISPARIPELEHIFEAVDHLKDSPPPAPKPAPKPVAAPRPTRRPAAAPLDAPKKSSAAVWIWLAALAVLGAVSAFGYRWYLAQTIKAVSSSKSTTRDLILDRQLPPTSLYGSIRQYMNDKQLVPSWLLEQTPTGLWHVTLSWADRGPSSVYAFEVNLEAQSVRGLNTAAAKLLAEGFPRPNAPAPTGSAPKPKDQTPPFDDALNQYQGDVQNADFGKIWDCFSDRKHAEMSSGGISQEGYVRLQTLTRKLEKNFSQEVLKTKSAGNDQMLVLLRQTYDGGAPIYLKQTWVLQDHAWRLDEEAKKMAEQPAVESAAPAAETPPAQGTSSTAPSADTPSAQKAPANPQAVLGLPGLSN